MKSKTAHSTVAGAHSKTKHVVIKHHHAKPVRKRHISLLAFFLLAGLLIVSFVISYRYELSRGVDNAEDYINSVFGAKQANQRNINSSYGFNVTYDNRQFFAGGLDSATGNLFIGDELQFDRAYEQIRFSPVWYDQAGAQSSITIRYYPSSSVGSRDDQIIRDLESGVVRENFDSSLSTISSVSSETVLIGGQDFTKNVWEIKSNPGVIPQLSVTLTTYLGVVNGKPMIIKANNALSDGSQFNSLLDKISFSKNTVSIDSYDNSITTVLNSNRNLLESLVFGDIAKAESDNDDTSASERVSSLYSPAVVKIYNLYCQDIKIDGLLYLKDACKAGTGSGFFVSPDGYIATNGHVASSNVKDIVISDAVLIALLGNNKYLNYLATISGVTQAEVTGKSTEDVLEVVTNKIYALDDSRFSTTNSVVNLLVGLNETQPDLTELSTLTKSRQSYTEQDSIKQAKMVDMDYRAFDGYNGFKASDVALIKIDGSNYPTVSLGSIDGLNQGSELIILGYPGIASTNGLVESTESKVTLTAGTVSAVKNAEGGEKKLVETDTEIGSGNSGGPAFDHNELVIGLATYSVAGSKNAGTFNYIRDIQDLKDLASKNNLSIGGTSETQTEWAKGIESFYSARYSKALKNFEKVKELYPQHPRVAEFIETANTKIANGEDVKDFPILIVAAGGGVVLVGTVITLLLIIRHHKAHKAYNQHVASGGVPPVAGGAPQTVAYQAPVMVTTPSPAQPTESVTQPSVGTQQPAVSQDVIAPNAQVIQPTTIQPTQAQTENTPTVSQPTTINVVEAEQQNPNPPVSG